MHLEFFKIQLSSFIKLAKYGILCIAYEQVTGMK